MDQQTGYTNITIVKASPLVLGRSVAIEPVTRTLWSRQPHFLLQELVFDEIVLNDHNIAVIDGHWLAAQNVLQDQELELS